MGQRIVIVNENDEIIGESTKEIAAREKLIYRVSALWVKNSKGENLLARRAYSKKQSPGRFGPAVAGTVEVGESYEKNIIKEAEEELGITGVYFKIGPKIFLDGKFRNFTQWFTCTLDKDKKDFILQEDEVAEIRWFSNEELKDEFKKHPEEFIDSMKDRFFEFFL